MSVRPKALLIAGGDSYHNLPEHYEQLAGLLSGPGGCNLSITDDLPSITHQQLVGFDLLVLWTTMGQAPVEAVDILFDTVRNGIPLLGLHAAPYTVRMVPGGPEAIGSSYIKRFPHLPYQRVTVDIARELHPITSGIGSFAITDELYCLEELPSDATVLATYNGLTADAPYVVRPGTDPSPGHALAHEWRSGQPRAPLVYTKALGNGTVVVNALGHDGQALANPSFRALTVNAVQWLTQH